MKKSQEFELRQRIGDLNAVCGYREYEFTDGLSRGTRAIDFKNGGNLEMTVVLDRAFDIPYVLFSVLPKLRQMNPNLYEAALDLGCHPVKALYKVIVPEITPGIFTGALLAFTMSLDDFVISYFTSNTDQNLAMIVYSAARRGVEPTMYALSTLMFIVVLGLLLIVNRRNGLEEIA